MTKHPANDFEFYDDAEDAFVKWFNDFYGSYSLRAEWFYGDCEIGDEKQRKDILAKWIHSSFVAGWEAANCGIMEENVGLTE